MKESEDVRGPQLTLCAYVISFGMNQDVVAGYCAIRVDPAEPGDAKESKT
jgi:hypothetical protein